MALAALECRADGDSLVYTGIVKPIFASTCVSCHGEKKQKKQLRLDSLPAIMKGGKDGVVVVPGNVDKSDLIDRITLDLSDDDHMPPKGKPQLTDKQIQLLQWWVKAGDARRRAPELGHNADRQPLSDGLERPTSSAQGVQPFYHGLHGYCCFLHHEDAKITKGLFVAGGMPSPTNSHPRPSV